MEIKKGIIAKPVKAVIYGVEGIGKTTFASQFPQPLFFDLDKGSARLNVDRVTDIVSWAQLISSLKQFGEMEGNPYHTLVLDTADAAAAMCSDYVVKTNGKKSIEDFGYGKGYVALREQFSILLVWLESLVDRGFNVVVLAHAIQRTVTRPDAMGAYDHWEMKLPGSKNNSLSSLLKEWADLLLFADYQTTVVQDGSKKKARAGNHYGDYERIMYTTHTPFADAKNRFGLADVLPFDYGQIAKIVAVNTTSPLPPPAEEPATPAPVKTKPAKSKKPAKQPAGERKAVTALRERMQQGCGDTDDFARGAITDKELLDAINQLDTSHKLTKLEEISDEDIRFYLQDAQWKGMQNYILEHTRIPF